ncbi:hypothetical protein F4775DRAFT_594632 [Biscogniauxia sp. FL1348]|nr:hypothetical protein F4775DRAFT_594632 [Biscogniauxia sp. FL1348]
MAMTVRPGQFVLSESSCTEAALPPLLSSSECVSSLPTGVFDPAQGGTPDPATTRDTVAIGHATVLYPQDTPIDSSTDPVPTTFKTAIPCPRSTAPSSPHSAVRLVSRSASENSTAIGAGVGGGLGGALLLALGFFLVIRYRKKRITTEAEDGKAVSPEPQQLQEEQQEQQLYYHQQQRYDDSQPKPECTPSPISGPEVYKKSEPPSLSDCPEHRESTPSGPIELEAAPVSRAMTPSLQGDGHYIDRGGEFPISEAPAPVPVELPGTEVSIAELESPHLTATSPTTITTTITVLSTAPTITTATTATTPTIARPSSSAGRGAELTAHQHHHHQQQPPPRTPTSLISRAISPSPSVFSYTSAAPSEIHSLNEDAPRVLNAEERRRQLVALQEEARRREEGPLRRI